VISRVLRKRGRGSGGKAHLDLGLKEKKFF
jgi:hypothetical protein